MGKIYLRWVRVGGGLWLTWFLVGEGKGAGGEERKAGMSISSGLGYVWLN